MKITMTRCTKNPIEAINEASGNCYNKSSNVIDECYDSGHLSVFEFCDFTFHIEGVSRALLAQLSRYRHTSLAVRSQRYVDEGSFKYVVPNSITEGYNKNENYDIDIVYKQLMAQIDSFYKKLISSDIPKEDARYILPNACCTNLELKMNLRELMHFMNERLCSRAQWEIRGLAINIKNIVTKDYPELNRFLVPKCEINKDLHFCTEAKSCGRRSRLCENKNTKDNVAKKIIIVNGYNGVGKDTFAEILNNYIKIKKISSVDKIKEIASLIGWVGQKSEKDRKFLSALKRLTSGYNDLAYNYTKECIFDFRKPDNEEKILILDIREPLEIERIKKEFNAITLLIINDRVKQIESNDSDAGVFGYDYDYLINNSGSLEEFESAIVKFIKWLERT